MIIKKSKKKKIRKKKILKKRGSVNNSVNSKIIEQFYIGNI